MFGHATSMGLEFEGREYPAPSIPCVLVGRAEGEKLIAAATESCGATVDLAFRPLSDERRTAPRSFEESGASGAVAFGVWLGDPAAGWQVESRAVVVPSQFVSPACSLIAWPLMARWCLALSGAHVRAVGSCWALPSLHAVHVRAGSLVRSRVLFRTCAHALVRGGDLGLSGGCGGFGCGWE